MNTSRATITELRDSISSGATNAEAVVRDCLDRIERHNGDLNAFLETFPERAMARARAVDSGEVTGPLAGVPIALKDNICLDHGRTTCASRFLERYESPYSATSAQRLIDAGAVIVGKTNMDEFAMGSSGEHSAFGPTANPWDHARVPGGSSSGSACAVGAGLVPAALGSDTGGSIRQPASFCGVVGLKPTYGRISRYGLVAFASSLDQIGPFTRSVADSALLLSVLAGFDPLDSTSAQLGVPEGLGSLEAVPEGLTIGIPTAARSAHNHPSVNAALDRSADALRSAGATIVDVELPHIDHGIAAYYIIAPAEASSNLARFDGVRFGRRAALGPGDDLATLFRRSRAEGFGHEVQSRIMLGTHVLSSGYYDAYYNTALRVRRRIKMDYDQAFEAGCHALLLPAAPEPAFKQGEKLGDALAMYLADVYTVGVNLAGLPGVTVPVTNADVDGARLPIGMQLIGPALGDGRLLQIARRLETLVEYSAPL